MRQLNDCLLYGILDLGYVDILDVTLVAGALIEGGVDLIQLRGKEYRPDELITVAGELHEFTSTRDVPLIINDYPEIARAVPLEGVHVGQNDSTIADVRKFVGRPVRVGKSTHSFEQAVAAQEEGADYIGFGPLFATPTKPDYPPIGLHAIRKIHNAVQIPIFCIGGIKLNNLDAVIAAGAQRVVIVSDLLQAEDVETYAKAAKALLVQKKPSSISNQEPKI
jgi:thiamine-phosphate pyrophosphorylase